MTYAHVTKKSTVTPLSSFASSDIQEVLATVSSSGDVPVHLLRRGTEDYSVLFDVSAHPVKFKTFCVAARQLFPSQETGLGLITHKDWGCTIVEMSLLDEDACSFAMAQGATVNGHTFHGVRALRSDHKLTRLELSQLPLISSRDLEIGLRECLSLFGHVLHLGLYYEPHGGWFMGKGYVGLWQMDNSRDFER